MDWVIFALMLLWTVWLLGHLIHVFFWERLFRRWWCGFRFMHRIGPIGKGAPRDGSCWCGWRGGF